MRCVRQCDTPIWEAASIPEMPDMQEGARAPQTNCEPRQPLSARSSVMAEVGVLRGNTAPGHSRPWPSRSSVSFGSRSPPPAADLQQQPDVGPDTPRVLPCRCPRCGARMILIEVFARGCQSFLLPPSPPRALFEELRGLAGISSARRLRPQIFVLKQTTLSIRKSASPVAKRRNECAKYP
jgi:hypothetical protein